MQRIFIKFIMLLVVLGNFQISFAQDDDDAWYRLELGGGIGLGSMMNDANSSLMGNTSLAATLVARFPLNPRMAVKTALTYMNAEGDLSKVKQFYPAPSLGATEKRLQYEYASALYDLTVMYELHFLPYGYLPSYLGYSRIVPYMQLGLSATYSGITQRGAFSVPIGVGVKYKLSRRLNLGADWRINFSTSDKLEGLEAPMKIESSGFKNKDHYNQFLVTLTYDLSPKCPTCNKY